MAKETNVNIISDGGTLIAFWATEAMGPGIFSLVMADDGGYSSILLGKQDWEIMKTKIDAEIEYFEKHGLKDTVSKEPEIPNMEPRGEA